MIETLEQTVDTHGINGVEKILKLTTTVSTTNMNMFNEHRQLHKYRCVEEIIDGFYEVRMEMYAKRKAALVLAMKGRVQELSNRARFILEVVANTLDLRSFADDAALDNALASKQYDKHQDKYDYLTHMPIHTMTKARVQKLLQEKEDIIRELEVLEKTALTTMWLTELERFEQEYAKYKQARKASMDASVMDAPSQKKKTVARRKK
jgi:DNA topoisomerase II